MNEGPGGGQEGNLSLIVSVTEDTLGAVPWPLPPSRRPPPPQEGLTPAPVGKGKKETVYDLASRMPKAALP